ncbi:hypothetical protein [uncultured Algoriphagus sp.]|uniref:hypothetical protein n=1 Tax=uncultured Algoriphagus sp. TaxID=417365 RepID=UPI00259898B9|nr:hypothetical protein [uncultured Algoriphagus sp.]
MNRAGIKSGIVLLVIILFSGLKVSAQFMRTYISLDPGVTSISGGTPRIIIPTISIEREISSSRAWVEFRTLDNLQLAIDYKGSIPSDSLNNNLLLINNGTENFSSAIILKKNSFVLLKNPSSINKESNSFKVFSAWVGIPILFGRQITIHYP